jgi:hypothetical protein
MKLSTLAIARDLESAGFTKAQAESIAEKFIDISEQQRDELVTKDYLKAQLSEFKTQLADLSVEIKNSHINAIKWLVGLLAGFLALMCSFIYFLVK